MQKPAFYKMSLQELSKWVYDNDCLGFDIFPATDGLDDDEQIAAREEYESMAEEIYATMGN